MRPSILSNRITALVFVIAGMVWAVLKAPDVWHGMASSHWPSTEAKLIHTEVVQETHHRWASRHSNSVRYTYTPYATYHYKVDGVQRTANVISFGQEFVPANRVIENLKQETPLLAYYDSEDPNRAVLHPGVQTL